MKKDKRCQCLVCIVQSNCTDYCTKFHFYRKILLAETDVLISNAAILKRYKFGCVYKKHCLLFDPGKY